MAMDITGISNENEFYTHHYLSAILETDLKDVFSQWKNKEDEQNIPQPWKQLRSLRKEFFNESSVLERERNVEERMAIQRQFARQLLSSLGYEYYAQVVELDDNGSIPLSGAINRPDGSPELWIIEVVNVEEEDIDPLELNFLKKQYPADEEIQKILDIPMEEIITRQVFGRTEPPRWVILMSFSQMILLDRTKWHEKRLLRFDVREILDRRETSTLQAMAALLHRDSICPEDGMPLLDTLDENSHKHAFAVSEDLKYSLREAIELLGNEAVYYQREILHEKIYGRDMAGQLTRECLRYMYRLLFLFYIEARPELGYLPDKSPEYRKGYSLESLRDLEMIKLTTDESRNGFYIHESVQILFNLLYNGFQPKEKELFGNPDHDTFDIAPLRSHLFDPKQTSILNKVKLRNSVMQRIIELMSLSRPKKGKKNRRGRISYKQLGINQLGAVYEALLSYQGFFAETELYEVKKAGEHHNVLDTAYFVKPEDIEQYTEDELVFNDDGTLVKNEKGTFIYRLAGRDREKSASYYTPEVLTQCLVKYALKELLKDKTADEILKLTVCEPAMGSAAFLNETVNQLSKAYLDLKQKETGHTISHDDYPGELQKVKMYIADNNVHGVDLNPVAVELAEVSLWLNTIYEGGFVPWFGMQLVCGNSLIGARRQVFHESLLKKKSKTDPLWLDVVPKRVMPGDKREKDSVYHFLLPDKGMADYRDKVIKQMAGDEIKAINEWRNQFTKPFTKTEIDQLKKLSAAIDNLWEKHGEMQRFIDARTTDPLYVFGQKTPDKKPSRTTTEEKDQIFQQEMFSKNVRDSSPYRRLKLVMDYWCALWFWPIQQADLLPSRAEFLFDLSLILEGNLYDANVDEKGQHLLFPDTRPRQLSLNMLNELGHVDVDRLCRENKRLGLVTELVERYRYLHWELEFADLFERRGGFDLVLGNPPWIKLEWNEGGVMGDASPLFVLKKYSASKVAELREDIFKIQNFQNEYFMAYEAIDSCLNFFNNISNYHYLSGSSKNLYKCFINNSFWQGNDTSVLAFVTDTGIFDEKKGINLREESIKRLSWHFKFRNELKLFPMVGNQKKFEVNIFDNKNLTQFKYCANLFHPLTLDDCLSRKDGIIPHVRDENGWVLKGHQDRIINIDKDSLTIFSIFLERDPDSIAHTRFPKIHSKNELNVIKKLTESNVTVGAQKSFFSTVMYDENASQKKRIIKRHTDFNNKPVILSGPHIHCANPFYQTPKRICNTHRAYDIIYLDNIPDNYTPRTNYILLKDEKDIIGLDFFRIAFRRRLNPEQERTFLPALISPGVRHIHPVVSCGFQELKNTLNVLAFSVSIIADYWVKISSKEDFYGADVGQFPLLNFFSEKYLWVIQRILALNCLTDEYKNIYSQNFNEVPKMKYQWFSEDQRLSKINWNWIDWNSSMSLRNSFSRRMAEIEIDVGVAINLGLTFSDLLSLFNSKFELLKLVEADTWYDRNGQIAFTSSKGLPGVGFPRKSNKTNPIGWEDIKDMPSGTVERTIIDDTMPGGPIERTITYEAPFDRCDREKDYEIAWKEFEKRLR